MNESTAKWIQSTIQCRQCYNRVPQSEVQSDFRCRACHQVTAIFPNGESNRGTWIAGQVRSFSGK